MVMKTGSNVLSFSIESLMRTDTIKKERTTTMIPLTDSQTLVPTVPVRSPIYSATHMIPDDLRADEELSECSDTSGRVSSAHNSTCSTPGSDMSASSSLNTNSDSSLDYIGTPILTRKKKARTAFTQKQIDDLEKRYESQKYLSATERGDLADELDLTDQQVKTWFQNRRMKEKRLKIEKSDGPSFPTGGVDVAQLHALGIPCPLPPGALQYKAPTSVHPSHRMAAPQYMPSPLYRLPLAYHSSQMLPSGFPMFHHPYAFPYSHQMGLPIPAFGTMQ